MGIINGPLNRQLVASQERLLRRFLFDRPYAERMSHHPVHAYLGLWLPRGEGTTVLELGCGPGKYVALLQSLSFSVVGVDPCQFPTWEIIRRETSATLLDGVSGETLPFPDGYFDHAVCLGAVLYFDDVKRAMDELRRVVKPGGRVIIRTVNKNNLYTRRTGRPVDPASRHLFTMEELTRLIRDHGFSIEGSYSYGFWPPYCPELWWYMVCVWLPLELQHSLSCRLSSEHRINNVVLATVPLN